MNLENELDEINSYTQIAIPTDKKYVYRLGVALYGFASISSFMAEVTARLDPSLNHSILQDGTGATILKNFQKSVNVVRHVNPDIGRSGDEVSNLFESLNFQRTDIIHGYPITNHEENQILHRRKDSHGKYFEVTNEFLDNFISRLSIVNNMLYIIRKLA